MNILQEVREQLGYLFEQIVGSTAQRLKDDLSILDGFENFSDDDWNDLSKMMKQFGWSSVVFTSATVPLVKYFMNPKNGLPATWLFLMKGNQFKTDKYPSEAIINLLTNVGVFEELDIPAKEGTKIYHVPHDAEFAKKHPKKYIKSFWATPELDKFLKFLKKLKVPIKGLWSVFEEEY